MQAQRDLASELQDVLHHEIPLSQQIGLTVAGYDGTSLSLRAPLAPNLNHKATAFAGSLNAVMTLAGWGMMWLLLREHGLRGVVVIHESATRYQLPVAYDFMATCRRPTERQVERFIHGLSRRGVARLHLTVEILDSEGQEAVAFSGSYVAFLSEKERGGVLGDIEG